MFLRPDAAEDLIAARNWYDRQKPDLGDRFSARVAAALEQLAVMPELFATQWQDVRACRLRKFPYVVYYRVLVDCVEVLAVLHGSRDSST